MRQNNTHTNILVEYDEVETSDVGVKVIQERITYSEAVKVKAKQEAKTSSNVDENKVDEKNRVRKTMYCCNRYVPKCVFDTD